MQGTDDPVTNHINVSFSAEFNPNSADWRALVAVAGVTEEVAKSLVLSRRSADTQDISGLLFSGPVDDPFGPLAFVARIPADTIVVTFRYANSIAGTRMAIKHTPASNDSPWLIRYVHQTRFADADKVPETVSDLPSLSSIADAHAQVQVQSPF